MSSEVNKHYEYIPAQRFADLILDIGTHLLSSGAHCGRICNNLKRLAVSWNFEIHIDPSFKGLLVKVRDRNDPTNTATSFKQSPPHIVHLAALTETSHLVWRTYDESLTIYDVEKEFEEIKNQARFPNYIAAIAVGFSCSGLCLLNGGDFKNAGIALIAAALGFLVKLVVESKKFNTMISIGIAAFVTTMLTGLANLYNIGAEPQVAMATAVLYLVPGVPLINCVIDLIDGYLSSAINRALFGGFILLCIATAMTLCITVLGISNFN